MRRSYRNILYTILAVLAALFVAYLCLPYYARQALIHLMPVIDDAQTFSRDTVRHDPSNSCPWPRHKDYNRYLLTPSDSAYLDSLHTVSFLVVRRDSILYESYRDGWNDTLTSNLYSATKTIVGLLVGIALDEGKIRSLDDPVSAYIPIYKKGQQADVTLRHLLTMSGGMAWDEAYASLFSVTTRVLWQRPLRTGHRPGRYRKARHTVLLPQRRDPTPGLCPRSRHRADPQPICRRKTLATLAG